MRKDGGRERGPIVASTLRHADQQHICYHAAARAQRDNGAVQIQETFLCEDTGMSAYPQYMCIGHSLHVVITTGSLLTYVCCARP